MKPAANSTVSDAADDDLIRPLSGISIGLLTADELSALSRCVVRGTAERVYTGVAGMLGLGKVLYIGAEPSTPPSGPDEQEAST